MTTNNSSRVYMYIYTYIYAQSPPLLTAMDSKNVSYGWLDVNL